MGNSRCFHCGYDLTGLGTHGQCPECGRRYDTQSLAPNTPEHEHILVSYLPALAMLVVTLAVVGCGGLIAFMARNPKAIVATTLLIAAVTAFMGFTYAWLAHKERRGE